MPARCRWLLCAGALAPSSAFSGKRPPNFGPNFVPSTRDNMNGAYPMSPTPGGRPGQFPKRFADYPGGVESYDVYSPAFSTLYSQVWWQPLAPAPFPEEMVRRYNGTGAAIVGWEIDQVRRTPSGDVSVPISASYNHHYVTQLIGSGARFRRATLDGPDDPRAAGLGGPSAHAVAWDQPQYIAEQVQERELPSHQYMQSGNGGEYRKT